jgi:hypothetical protein
MITGERMRVGVLSTKSRCRNANWLNSKSDILVPAGAVVPEVVATLFHTFLSFFTLNLFTHFLPSPLLKNASNDSFEICKKSIVGVIRRYAFCNFQDFLNVYFLGTVREIKINMLYTFPHTTAQLLKLLSWT